MQVVTSSVPQLLQSVKGASYAPLLLLNNVNLTRKILSVSGLAQEALGDDVERIPPRKQLVTALESGRCAGESVRIPAPAALSKAI